MLNYGSDQELITFESFLSSVLIESLSSYAVADYASVVPICLLISATGYGKLSLFAINH